MKKLICAALLMLVCAAVPAVLSVPSYAVQCAHEYSAAEYPATCIERAHTVYTCKKCGYGYTAYADEYTPPEGLYVVAFSERSGDTVKVNVYLYNNPGIETARLQVTYNQNSVIPVSFENGEVWPAKDYLVPDFVNIDPSSDHVTVFTEHDGVNTNNGLYFSLNFKIVGDYAENNLNLKYSKKDFVVSDEENKVVLEVAPQLINLMGKSDLGEHLWKLDRVVREADFEQGGEEIHVCSVCKSELTVTSAPLEHWLKGDLDNNGLINAKDCFIMKLVVTGNYITDNTLQLNDAADINCDGRVNPKDSYAQRILLLG